MQYKETMDEKTCDRILAACDECFCQDGMDFNQGLRKFRNSLEAMAQVFGQVRSRATLKVFLLKAHLSAEQAASIIAMIEYLPWLTYEASRDLPHDSGGEAIMLSHEKRELARAKIEELTKTIPLRQAIIRTATEFDVSERKMWNVWTEDPATVDYWKQEIRRRVRQPGTPKPLKSQPR